MTVRTRFAPSPTGYLHIGGARTALFNWLYARHHGGEFHLRIEDTDRARSTQGAIDAILEGMRWLGLDWDGDVVYQYARAPRHAEVAHAMLEAGQAYRCYLTPAEIEAERERAKAEGKIWRYPGTWRDRPAGDAPAGVQPVIRLKAPVSGPVTVEDQVQGSITVDAKELDDMVLLRSDGTPTYMLAVVVDDHDMGITHVIRGADHLTNTFRQALIYRAMGWSVPHFAHIPLIHGADGAKLSKRHGALGVEAYRDMGYLPEAMRNYLLRLGWSHGDDETISTAQAIEWFNLESVGKSPARFDFAKLENVSGHYLREADDARLVALVFPLVPPQGRQPLSEEMLKTRLLRGMPGLKQRAKTLVELAENAAFYINGPAPMDAKALDILEKGGRELLRAILPALEAAPAWAQAPLEEAARAYAEATGAKLGAIAQPLRVALTGRTVSPGVFEALEVLGREESLARLQQAAA